MGAMIRFARRGAQSPSRIYTAPGWVLGRRGGRAKLGGRGHSAGLVSGMELARGGCDKARLVLKEAKCGIDLAIKTSTWRGHAARKFLWELASSKVERFVNPQPLSLWGMVGGGGGGWWVPRYTPSLVGLGFPHDPSSRPHLYTSFTPSSRELGKPGTPDRSRRRCPSPMLSRHEATCEQVTAMGQPALRRADPASPNPPNRPDKAPAPHRTNASIMTA